MSGARGREKGARFMRDICEVFTRWLDPTLPQKPKPRQEDLSFRVRSTAILPSDGHWHGRGDILCRPDIYWPFTTECKKHEGWELDGMLANGAWPVWSWWSQTTKQASADGGAPLLVFSRNLRANYVLIQESTAECLRLVPKNGPVMRVAKPDGQRLVLALLADLVAVPPRSLRDIVASSPAKRSSRRSRRRSESNTRSRTT